MTKTNAVAIEVVEDESGKVVRVVPLRQPASERYTERVMDGMSINLDHARYSLRIKTEES
jgi:hypothetical protein